MRTNSATIGGSRGQWIERTSRECQLCDQSLSEKLDILRRSPSPSKDGLVVLGSALPPSPYPQCTASVDRALRGVSTPERQHDRVGGIMNPPEHLRPTSGREMLARRG